MSRQIIHNDFIVPSQMVRFDVLAHRFLTEQELLWIVNQYQQTPSWRKDCASIARRRESCTWLRVVLKSPIGFDPTHGTTIKMRPSGRLADLSLQEDEDRRQEPRDHRRQRRRRSTSDVC